MNKIKTKHRNITGVSVGPAISKSSFVSLFLQFKMIVVDVLYRCLIYVCLKSRTIHMRPHVSRCVDGIHVVQLMFMDYGNPLTLGGPRACSLIHVINKKRKFENFSYFNAVNLITMNLN